MDNFQPLEILLVQFVEFLPKLITAIVIFIIALFLSSWLANLTAKAMRHRDLDTELILLSKRVVRITVMVLGTIQALAQVDFNVTGFVAGLGLVGFTIGFAMQDVTKNFVAGILLLIQQPFDLGDSIEVTGYSGTVTDITLRTTEVRTWDGRDVLIPNGDVYVKPITNYSRDPRRRLQISVSVDKDWDLENLTNTVLRSLRDGEGVLEEPNTEAVWTTSTEGKTELSAYFWVDTSQVDLRSAQNTGVAAVRGALIAAADDFSFSVKAPLLDAP
ncbi:MAG: mechanosensitive ion channel family protein [Anaerolineales bacterium]